MRLVHFSDLHLDSQFSWLGEDVQAARARRRALRETLQRITALVRAVGADALLCGGDLYEHDRVAPDTGAFLRRSFEELQPVQVYLAPGNHDWYGPQSLYHRVGWPSNVHVFTTARLEPVGLRPGITLPFVVGGVLAVAGLATLALGLYAVGAPLLVVGAGVVVWALTRGDGARLKALEELRAAEQAVGEQRHDLERARRARERSPGQPRSVRCSAARGRRPTPDRCPAH